MNSVASASTLPAPAVSPAPLVGNRAARGALWTLFFSLLNKGTTLGAQIALAWFLVPEDFGLVAMTLSITSFAGTLCGSNLKNLLIQRSASFQEEAGQVFWLSLGMNATAAFLLMSFSPLAGLIFKEPRVVPLILVAALAAPVQALPTIYAAALNRELRFRSIAMIHFGAGLVQSGSAVLLAWLGFGAYALIWPAIIMAAFMAISFRAAAGRIRLGRPEPRRWIALQKPLGWLMAQALFAAVQGYGANFVIGLTHSPAIAGFYYWGFTVSSQAIFLLATNLQGVLFPALSRLNADPARQFQAVHKAVQTLTVVVVPVCLAQMILARPLIQLLFRERWLQSVPVVEWLSVGMLTQPLSLIAGSVLLARGRFKLLAITTGATALALIMAAGLGARLGDHTEIARCTGTSLLLANLLAGWVVYREFGEGWKRLIASIGRPLLLGVPVAALSAGAAAVSVDLALPVRVMIPALVCLLSHALLVRLFLPSVATEILVRIRPGKPADAAASHSVCET